jgi:hypothetical protein
MFSDRHSRRAEQSVLTLAARPAIIHSPRANHPVEAITSYPNGESHGKSMNFAGAYGPFRTGTWPMIKLLSFAILNHAANGVGSRRLL